MTNRTKYYLNKVRKKTDLSDYNISQKYSINQSNLSKYKSGKATLYETHAWLFANILNISSAKVATHTKFEHAKFTDSKSKHIFCQNQLEKLANNSKSIKIDIAQINPIVGDLNGNTQKIIKLTQEAYIRGCDLLVFPELSLIGYPPEDLLLHEGFVQQVQDKVTLINQTISNNISIIFGAPYKKDDILYNSAYLIQNSKVYFYHKQNLPNYGVFDEKRYFKSGNEPFIFECQGKKISLVICEDAWTSDIISTSANKGVQIIISINASPFQIGKHSQRIEQIKQRVLETKTNFIYVNMVGAQDELVFDGASFAMNSNANITLQLPLFKEAVQSVSFTSPITLFDTDPIEKTIYDALVLATKDYIEKNDVFNGVVIGLSGGIDSALTLAIAVDAIGAEHVKAIMMPYKYTSNISLEDAKIQATTMNVDYHEININIIVDSFKTQLNTLFIGMETDTTEENIQARIRGTLLMAISNKLGKIVLTTSNKSEIAVGYTTLYGDMSGGFAPLKDVNKTLVYQLAKYRNTLSAIIPKRVIDREPSAELAPNQADQDSLPSYNELDAILALFIEQKYSVKHIIKQGFNEQTVKYITQMVLNNEYKRRQSAPGPKISLNAFGKERRYPMTSKFQP